MKLPHKHSFAHPTNPTNNFQETTLSPFTYQWGHQSTSDEAEKWRNAVGPVTTCGNFQKKLETCLNLLQPLCRLKKKSELLQCCTNWRMAWLHGWNMMHQGWKYIGRRMLLCRRSLNTGPATCLQGHHTADQVDQGHTAQILPLAVRLWRWFSGIMPERIRSLAKLQL